MNTSIKAILLGFPLAILFQFIVALIVRETHQDEPSSYLLGCLGFLNGMAAFFIIKRHLVKNKKSQKE